MDLYITDSLQDMLDMDIKSEMATDLNSITDFSDTFGLSFSDLPPLLDMDTDNSATWLNTSSFVHNLDLYGSEANAVMVNPNSVMPSSFAETPTKKIVNEDASDLMLTSAASPEESRAAAMQSPKEEKSHLTFSPNPIKIPKVQEPEEIAPTPPAPQPPAPVTKKTLEEATQMVIYVRKQDSNVVKDLLNDLESKKAHKVVNVQTPTPTMRIKTAPSELIKISNNKKCSIVSSSQKVTQHLGPKTIISGNIHILDAQQSRTILANSASNKATILFDNTLSGGRKLIKSSESFSLVHPSGTKYVSAAAAAAALGDFPKPAYSYSCLIAMALKNSRTGSLPVSEIYNFMCQHFPYFKTAPNGWKNSVRHNLSLNKCFEKIEKPSTTGSQRKGCLWAMNPTKVGKMDEEVQKWSRKDPQAIKKAMVYPENLEALERGEMKYSGLSGDVDGDDADDADVDGDIDADADVELDAEVVRTEEEDDTVIEQEVSDQELEVEEVVAGTGLVGGTYRLLAAGPAAYLGEQDSGGELSDVEILDHSYEEIDVDIRKSMKLDLSLSDSYSIPAKRSRTTFIYQPASTAAHAARHAAHAAHAAHASRRKTPLVNRVALM